ncbi:MAG: ABC transporter substrate-binding protein [Rhabdochlamydiaceae bacterium]|nr:ABC transporter substrate-binding protein [Rhabdochlamydiaceae bacterium]
MLKFKAIILILIGMTASYLNGSEKPTLNVGTTSGYAPFVSLNAQGEYEGFDIDVAELLAKELNRKLVIKDLGSMPSLFIGLKQGKIDVAIWAISITPERLKQMNMIPYQGNGESTFPLLFWKQIPEEMTSLEDLERSKKYTISVEVGSYQEQVLRAYPSIPRVDADKITDALLNLKFKKVTAIAIEPAILPNLLKQNPELRVLNCPLPKELQEQGNGIALTKENTGLTAEIQRAIENLRAQGKLQELEKKWGLQ